MTNNKSSKIHRKRSISKTAKDEPVETTKNGVDQQESNNNKSIALIDKNDLPARLNAVISLSQADEGIGEFEDAWEDEFENENDSDGHSVHFNMDDVDDDEEDEEDPEIIPGDGHQDRQEDGTDEGRSQSASPEPYLPHIHGSKLADDEELVADPTAYKMLHTLSLTWPALSFDVLRDDLGEQRSRMPHSACIVAGTQAAISGDVDQDEIMIMKWEGLSRMRKDPNLEDEDEELEDEEDEDEDEDEVDEEPTLTFKTIPHKGSVNRIKAQSLTTSLALGPPRPPDNYFVASFSGTGKVHIFDIAPHLYSLQHPSESANQTIPKKSFHTISHHGRAEGFALSWGPMNDSSYSGSLRLLTGDIHSKIYLTTSNRSEFTTNPIAYTSHTSSIEDLQWSPSEPTVFASCSADQSLKIWDIRVTERKNVLGIHKAHPADVNVLSWNKSTSYLIVTGGDEGGIKVWDLRNLLPNNRQHTNRPVADFNYHKSPITSIEWNPTEDSCFVASSADDQVTMWDLSVEVDDEEKKMMTKQLKIDDQIPDQLMFSHQGQKEIKEVHWHPQIPGCVISTALDGLNVFKTISI